MVRRRYNCELEYSDLAQLSPQESSLILTHNSKKPIRINGELSFLVSVRDQIVGVAKVVSKNNLCDSSISALQEVVSMVLESTLLAASSMEVIELLEGQLTPKSPSNVVNLARVRQSHLKTNDYVNTKSFDGNTSYNIPFMIEGSNFEDILRMAIEIHEQSRRYAFVHFDQLNHDVRTSFEGLESVGHVTLFVPDICALKDSEIFTMVSFMKSERTKESPQFIVGSVRTLKSVLERQIVPREFVELMSVGYLRMNKTFSEYRREGLTQFLFESLTRPPNLELT